MLDNQFRPSLHGLGWKHGTVTPAILHRDATVHYDMGTLQHEHTTTTRAHYDMDTTAPTTNARMHTPTNTKVACTHWHVVCTHTYWIQEQPRFTVEPQRELADLSWSGKSCTH